MLGGEGQHRGLQVRRHPLLLPEIEAELMPDALEQQQLVRHAVRVETGKTTYIGSWLTIVASTPELGLTTFPGVTELRPILPSMGARISV